LVDGVLVTSTLAIRLDFGQRLIEKRSVSTTVAEVLARPCFAVLDRLSGRRKDRWSKHVKPSSDAIAGYLSDPKLDAAALDNKRGKDPVASAEVENGVGRDNDAASPTRYRATAVLPYVATALEEVVTSACDLGAALDAAAGYIALEASYGLAHEVALGGFRPRERVGLSQQRFRERRGRHHYDDRLVAELAGVEWGTFLGPGHLAKVDLAELRRSGAFARVVEVTPTLAYLQVTEDPLDDLTEGFEQKLIAARRVLAPLLMDVSAMSLE
jgi:hypothetical protein